MNEPGSEFAYECKPAPAGNSKDDSFVVIKKETRKGGQVVPIALFWFQPDAKITVQVKPTGYVKTFEVKADGTFANFQGTIYDLVDEVMFQLPQIPI